MPSNLRKRLIVSLLIRKYGTGLRRKREFLGKRPKHGGQRRKPQKKRNSGQRA
jgi:hypothetical protein